MHRADPHANRPSPRWRARHDNPPHGRPASTLLRPPPDPGQAPWTPQRARVTLGELSHRRRLLGGYHVHPLDLVAAVLAIAALLAIFWPH